MLHPPFVVAKRLWAERALCLLVRWGGSKIVGWLCRRRGGWVDDARGRTRDHRDCSRSSSSCWRACKHSSAWACAQAAVWRDRRWGVGQLVMGKDKIKISHWSFYQLRQELYKLPCDITVLQEDRFFIFTHPNGRILKQPFWMAISTTSAMQLRITRATNKCKYYDMLEHTHVPRRPVDINMQYGFEFRLDSIAVSVFVIILVEFAKYWIGFSILKQLVILAFDLVVTYILLKCAYININSVDCKLLNCPTVYIVTSLNLWSPIEPLGPKDTNDEWMPFYILVTV